jgi:hypothetical protein
LHRKEENVATKVRQKNGKWWIFIDHKGKRKAKCVGDKRAAEQLKAKLDAKIALGDFEISDEKEQRPFATYFRTWLDTYAHAHCKDSTVAGYETAFRVYLLPRFGEQDITEISREAIKKLAYEMLAQDKSRSYVKATLAPLSEMFNHAIEDSHLAVNPALRILRQVGPKSGRGPKKLPSLPARNLLISSTVADNIFLPGTPSSFSWLALGCGWVKQWRCNGGTSTSIAVSFRYSATGSMEY